MQIFIDCCEEVESIPECQVLVVETSMCDVTMAPEYLHGTSSTRQVSIHQNDERVTTEEPSFSLGL